MLMNADADAQQQGANSVSPDVFARNGCIGPPTSSARVVAAVVVVAYNRLDYLQQCITSLLETHRQDQANRWASA